MGSCFKMGNYFGYVFRMQNLINSVFFYFLLPVYSVFALLLLFFNIPEEHYFSLYSFFCIVTIPVLLSRLVVPFKCCMQDYYKEAKNNAVRYRFVMLFFCA